MSFYFIVFAGLLVVVALLIILPPLWRQPPVADDDPAQRNLAIAKQRLDELKGQLATGVLTTADFESQRNELELALSEDFDTRKPKPTKPAGRWMAYCLAVAVPLVAIGLYAQLGTFQAIEPTPEMLGTQAQMPSLGDIEKMVAKLAARMQTNPDDAEGWMMLGKSYKFLQQFPKAADAFAQAYRLLGDKPDILLLYADALAFANNEQLAGKPAELVEKALALQPDNISALWLGGMVKAQAGDMQTAASRWRKLDKLLPPGSKEQQEVQALLAKVETRSAGVEPLAQTLASPLAAITINVSLAPELNDKVQASDSVFVYAQAASGPKMPLAIVRKTVADLPLTVTLTDAQAVMPTNKLSNHSEVKLLARITQSGGAKAQPGDLQGSIESVNVNDAKPHGLLINGVVK